MKSSNPPRGVHWILIAVAGIFSLPWIWLVVASLRGGPLAESSGIHWENYARVLRELPWGLQFRNSLILCGGSIVGTVISSALAGYAFARLDWRGSRFWFGVLLATMLLPWHVTVLPRFLMLRGLGLYDSLAALIVPTFFGNAFHIFLLRQFFRTIPPSLLEAARVDGLSEWGIFLQIVLPLSKSALSAVALFQGVATWNDLSGPLVFLSDPEKFPLSYGLEQFRSAYSDQTHLLMAAAVLFTLPIAVLFLCVQRTFIEGIATSGLKE